MKLKFSRQILEKHSNIKFHKYSTSGNQVPCGQADERTDRHDEVNCSFLQFCERAQKGGGGGKGEAHFLYLQDIKL
jgi:hypothetical protein